MSKHGMKKKMKSMLILAAMLSIMTGISAEAALVAKPSHAKVFINERQTEFTSYVIHGSNYFKLRDLAYSLNLTEKNFNVKWDAEKRAILLESKKAYEPTGGELVRSTVEQEKNARVTETSIYVDGEEKEFQAYNIDGSNYFQLRDIMQVFHIDVTWKEKENAIGINTAVEPKRSEEPKPLEQALSAKEIYEKCSSAIFYLETFDMDGNPLASGSGFFIDKDRAVTNFHVLEGAFSAKIRMEDNHVFNVTGITSYDAERDFAVIKVEGNGFHNLVLGDSERVQGGEKIYAIGSPMGLFNTISEGIISNQRRLVEGQIYIQISAPISHGSSGGALLNERGEVIGITTAGYGNGQNLNFAIPINHIKNSIREKRLTTLEQMTRDYTIEEYHKRPEAFTKIVEEKEPNDTLGQAQYIKNGTTVLGKIDDNYLDNYITVFNTPGVMEVYCFSKSENFPELALILEPLDGQTGTMATFEQLDDGSLGLYGYLPVKKPGYYHIVVLASEGLGFPGQVIDYEFYYEFTPEHVNKA